MTLQWQTVEVPMGAGQDESQEVLTIPVPLLQFLQNARVYKTGAVGKRPGWIAEASLATGERVLSVDDDLITYAPRRPTGVPVAAVELGSPNNTLQRIDYHGGSTGAFSLSEVEVLERKPLVRDVLTGDGTGLLLSSAPDFAVSANNRIAVIAWRVALAAIPGQPVQTVLFAMAIDSETRQVVTAPLRINAPASDPSYPIVLMSDANVAMVVYGITTTNQLRAVPYDCSTRTWGTDTLLATDLNATAVHYDACEFVGSTGWFVVYRNTTPLVKILKMTGTTVSASTTLAEDSSIGSCTCYADFASNNLWIAYYDATNGLRAIIKNATTIASTVLVTQAMEAAADTVMQMTWAPVVGGMVLIWNTDAVVSAGATGYGRRLLKFRTLSSIGAKGLLNSMPDVELISKAVVGNTGYVYCAVIYDGSDVAVEAVATRRSDSFQTAFTLEITDSTFAATATFGNPFRVAATWAIGEAGRRRYNSSLSNFRAVLAGGNEPNEAWFMLAPEFDQTYIAVGSTANEIIGRPGVDLCRQRFISKPPIFAARIGRNVVFSGGTPQVWDGVNLTEYGFLIPPENGQAVDTPAAESLQAGAYGVQLVWEYRLSNGDIVRSIPALSMATPGTFTIQVATATDKIVINAPTLNLTRKWNELGRGEGVILRAYRTEVNGSIYYQEGDFTIVAGFAANTPAATNLVVNVLQADSTATTHAQLYTTGGILPNYPPPALSYIFTHRNRLFGIVAENRRQIQFTHEYVPGELPGWHPDLVIDVPDEAVALGTVDEKLVILCKNGIYLVSGNGPDRKGLNSDYDQPFRLNSPHGCARAASVVSFPNGVMYQAHTGFCLVDRQTTVSRVGGPVEDTVALYPYAQSALVIQDTEWIYWAMTDDPEISNSFDGRTVVYDWRHNVWSVDRVTFTGELGPFATFITSYAQSKGQIFCTINANNALYLQGGSADPGPTWIYTYLRTAMIDLGSNSKFQRARWLTVLGEKRGIHQLAMTVTTFHHATSAPLSQFFIWTDAQLSVMQDYALKMHIKNQVGSYIQLELADGPDASFPTTYDDSARFATLALEIGLKRGTHQAAQAAME